MLLRALARQFPKAECTGIEFSRYLCGKYGWIEGSVTELTDLQADLVICNDVLGYLDATDCQSALNNLAATTSQALYLGVLTTEDMKIIDRSRTDAQQIDRPARWYRTRLTQQFVNAGGGLWLKQPLSVPLWSLEHLE
jgi:hypothetical protein